ncbi:MAG: type I-U CRISPR-associated protein Csx17 [Verrucomicrobiales bacterium]
MNQALPLRGCTPEPLMNYLKALGVFRIISEQVDPTCRAAWRGGQFALSTKLTEQELLEFFTENYFPSPIFSPWNAEGGFLTESGASFATIHSIQNSNSPRLAGLQNAIVMIHQMGALKDFGECRTEAKVLDKRKKAKQATDEDLTRLRELTKRVKSLKETILFQIRSEFPDSAMGWFDTCLQVGDDGFSVAPALGSGGVDGRMEFSANFLRNVLLVLDNPNARNWIASSLFSEGFVPLHAASIGQFSPGNVGGPNSTHGFEGNSAINPWDYILLIEGTPLLAGAITRRCGNVQFGKSAFPFTVAPVALEGESVKTSDSSTARGEVWLPLWEKKLRLNELERIFGEGRAEWSGAQSRTNIDFAKAVASYGADRGIKAFTRHSFLQRNGRSFLATPLGRYEVHSRENVTLLREADAWIDRYRRACGDKTPARFSTAARRVDSAVFNYCEHGGSARFQAIVIALGQAERELVTGAKFRESAWLRPLRGLSSAWVAAADDHSREFEIAVALAGVRGNKDDPGLRANLEPVEWKKGLLWRENSGSVVWNRGDLAANLVAVLERRVLDWRRLGLPAPAITSCRGVRPSTVAAFINAELDDDKIERLLWGLVCCKIDWAPESVYGARDSIDTAPLPRVFPLLKASLSGLHPDYPDALRPKKLDSGQADLWEKLILVTPEARLPHLLRAGRIAEAAALASRRTRSAGLLPASIEWDREDFPSTEDFAIRLAASLMLPISNRRLLQLWSLVARMERLKEPTA